MAGNWCEKLQSSTSTIKICFSRVCDSANFVFYLRPILAFGYCRCLCLSVSVCLFVRLLSVCVCLCTNPELVHARTHHPFKLGLPNLDQRCKTSQLRFLFLWGVMLKPSSSGLTLNFWACLCHNSSPFYTRMIKFGPVVQNTYCFGEWLT